MIVPYRELGEADTVSTLVRHELLTQQDPSNVAFCRTYARGKALESNPSAASCHVYYIGFAGRKASL